MHGDFHAPDAVWEAVERAMPFGHVLCFECFCFWCDRLSISFGGVWHLVPDSSP
jgi:hypothetical protein